MFGLSLSLQFTRVFLALRLREDAVMVSMLVTGLAGAALLSLGGWGLPLGFGLLFLHYIIDYCDGQIARQYGASSLVAAVRDRVIHFVVQASAFLGLGVYLWARHESAWYLLAPLLCYLWFQFRILIAHLPALVYCSEFLAYPEQERRIISSNHASTVRDEVSKTGPAASDGSPRAARRLRHEVREIAINFDGFTLLMTCIAAVAVVLERTVLPAMGLPPYDIVLLALWAWVVFYALNALDYAHTFAFSSRINTDITHLDRRIRGGQDTGEPD